MTDVCCFQYGLFDMPSSFDDSANGGIDMDADDSDLEAELLALTRDGGATKPKRPPRRVAPAQNLDAMVAASMKDVGSDEEMSGGDDDDPELLSELKNIAGETRFSCLLFCGLCICSVKLVLDLLIIKCSTIGV